MKASRMEHMESGFKDLHGIKPEIWCETDGRVCKFKIKHKKKEIYLQEFMEHGMTTRCTLTHDGKSTDYKSVFEAERAATQLMKD